MAWTSPTVRTTGELITASVWNTDLVANLNELRTGGLAIASQAALDFLYGSSATQLARLAAGTALQSPRINAAANGWEFAATGSCVSYTATLANVANTTVDTTTLSFSVPANAMADGNLIAIHGSALVKNNRGSAVTPNWAFLWGAVSTGQFSGTNWNDNATEFKVVWDVRVQRVVNDIWIWKTSAGGVGDLPIMFGPSGSVTPATEVIIISAPTFTGAQTFKINLQFSGAADATTYFKPQSANVTHFK